MVKAVVFDIGNVLIRWDPDQVYSKVMDADTLAQFHAETEMHSVNDQVDRGRNWKEAIEEAAARHPKWSEMIMLWYTDWHHMAAPAIDGSVRLLRALRSRGVPVFALSNFGVETFAFAEGHYDFLSEFDQRYISGHLKTIKPEPAIYQALEDGTGLSGCELLFVDDLHRNIAAAEARGWQGHVFEGPEGFARRLVQEQLLEDSDL